jgi:hypothetical protein
MKLHAPEDKCFKLAKENFLKFYFLHQHITTIQMMKIF